MRVFHDRCGNQRIHGRDTHREQRAHRQQRCVLVDQPLSAVVTEHAIRASTIVGRAPHRSATIPPAIWHTPYRK
jgi:hypothetical protein